MAGDDSKDRSWLWVLLMSILDGYRPSRALGWLTPVAPVVTQAAAGTGHWAAGRRQRALAEWAGAAGFGLVAWGLGTEAPTAAEVQENFRRLQKDMLRKRGIKAPAPAPAVPKTPMARRLSRFFRYVRPEIVQPPRPILFTVRRYGAPGHSKARI